MRYIFGFAFILSLLSIVFPQSEAQSDHNFSNLEIIGVENLDRLQLLAQIQTDTSIDKILWSVDNQYLAIAIENCVRVYTLLQFEDYEVHCHQYTSPLYVLDWEFMPNQSKLVVGWSNHPPSPTNIIEIWDFENNTVTWQTDGYLDGFKSLSLGYDGHLLVIGGGDDRWGTRSPKFHAVIWHLDTQVGFIPDIYARAVNLLQFSPDNRFVLQGDSASRLNLYEIATDKYVSALYHAIEKVEFIDTNRFIALSRDRIELWEIREEPEIHIVYVDAIPRNNALTATVDENLQGLAIWSTNNGLAIGDVRQQEPLFELALTEYNYFPMSEFSPNRRIVALNSSENVLQLWGVIADE